MSTTNTDVTAVDTLQRLIDDGWFLSGLRQEMFDIRHDPHAFYAKVLREEGVEAADAALKKWVERTHRDIYSSALEQIARGVATVAAAKPNTLKDISKETLLWDRVIDEGYATPRYKLVWTNQQAPGCGCMQPTGSDVFAPYGGLGLIAVVIESGFTYGGTRTTQLRLVFPSWGNSFRPPSSGSLSIVTLATSGRARGERLDPMPAADSPASTDQTLQFALGLAAIESGVIELGGGVHVALNFPGGEEYLATHLPKLRAYLSALAEAFGGKHSH